MEEKGVFGSFDIQEEISGHTMLHYMCQQEERLGWSMLINESGCAFEIFTEFVLPGQKLRQQ